MSEDCQQTFDVLVIGAGPAGAAAAYSCRRHGLSVALIDKASFPRDKLCGGLFTRRALGHYRDIFETDPPAEILTEKDRAEFWFQGERLGQMQGFASLFLTMRWDLDQRMFQKAVEAGAADYSGCRIQHLSLADKSLRLSSGEVLHGQILIGADGVNSLVARGLFGTTYDRARIGFAMEIEQPLPAPQPEAAVRIDFAAVAWGYGWSFPKKRSQTIGVGGLHRHTPDMKRALGDYFTLLGHDGEPPRPKGHFIPFGDFRRIPGRGPVLLCGDAAGLVDPVTGEGIAYALRSGQIAAEVAVQVLKEGNSQRAAQIYKRRLRPLHRSLRIARWIRPFFFSRHTEALFAASFHSSGRLKGDYMRLLAGELDYPTLGLQLLKRLPTMLLRGLRSRIRRR